MRIYISLPITGRGFDEVCQCVNLAKDAIRKKGNEPVSPIDQDTTKDYATLMGNDIRELLRCDAVLFLDGWKESRGCLLEHAAARIYEKGAIYGIKGIPDNPALWNVLDKDA